MFLDMLFNEGLFYDNWKQGKSYIKGVTIVPACQDEYVLTFDRLSKGTYSYFEKWNHVVM